MSAFSKDREYHDYAAKKGGAADYSAPPREREAVVTPPR